MKLKENFICTEEENIITLFDIFLEEFTTLNETATIIFNNIEMNESELIRYFEQNFTDLPLEFKEEVISMQKILKEKFFNE